MYLFRSFIKNKFPSCNTSHRTSCLRAPWPKQSPQTLCSTFCTLWGRLKENLSGLRKKNYKQNFEKCIPRNLETKMELSLINYINIMYPKYNLANWLNIEIENLNKPINGKSKLNQCFKIYIHRGPCCDVCRRVFCLCSPLGIL